MKDSTQHDRSAALSELGWQGHETAQLLRWAEVPLGEKLQWLEEAQRMVRRLTGAKPGTPARKGSP